MAKRRAADKREDVKTSLYLPRELLRTARVHAAHHDMRLREVFICALRAYLTTTKKEDHEK